MVPARRRGVEDRGIAVGRSGRSRASRVGGARRSAETEQREPEHGDAERREAPTVESHAVSFLETWRTTNTGERLWSRGEVWPAPLRRRTRPSSAGHGRDGSGATADHRSERSRIRARPWRPAAEPDVLPKQWLETDPSPNTMARPREQPQPQPSASRRPSVPLIAIQHGRRSRPGTEGGGALCRRYRIGVSCTDRTVDCSGSDESSTTSRRPCFSRAFVVQGSSAWTPCARRRSRGRSARGGLVRRRGAGGG